MTEIQAIPTREATREGQQTTIGVMGNDAEAARLESVAEAELAALATDGPRAYTHGRTARRDSLRRRALALADLMAILTACGAVIFVTHRHLDAAGVGLVLAIPPLWVLLHKILGLYDRDANLVHKSTLDELPVLAQAVSVGTAIVFVAAPILPSIALDQPQFAVFWATAIMLLPLARSAARRLVRRRVSPERVLIVGSGYVASLIAQKLARHPEYGAELVGCVDAAEDGHRMDDALALLGDPRDFQHLCRTFEVERVVVAFSSLSNEHLLDVIHAAKRMHLKVTIVPRLFEVIGPGVEIDQVEGMTVLGLRGVHRTKSTLLVKRGIDVAVASLGMLVLAPLLAAVAAAIKVTSPGPILFRQSRVGRGNEEFRMVKFRTMVDGADEMKADLLHRNEHPDERMFKIADDPRVTPVGKLLRRTSIDELPQLWNVVKGEMSLVGPRPLVPDESAHVIGWHRARLDLTPGLTGPWQVMGQTRAPFSEMVKLDYMYVADWSLWNDVKLLARTLPVVMRRTNQ